MGCLLSQCVGERLSLCLCCAWVQPHKYRLAACRGMLFRAPIVWHTVECWFTARVCCVTPRALLSCACAMHLLVLLQV